jgi:hypothetical protein
MSDLRAKLIRLVKELRAPAAEKIGRSMPNPLSGRPGFVFPDPYPPGASDKQLDLFSKQFGIPIPSDLSEWLRITNGGAGFFGVAPVHPDRDIEVMWKIRPYWLEKGWIPVGTDTFGNFYVLVPEIDKHLRGGVCFVEGTQSDQLSFTVASDTLHYAEFELEMRTVMKSYDDEYRWRCDKEFVTSKDPKIVEVAVAPMRWDINRCCHGPRSIGNRWDGVENTP